MTNPITAIYENGVLRPLTPLELPEHAQVQIYVQPAPPADRQEHRRQVHAALVAAGLSQPNADAVQPANALSTAEREQLARRFATERPLSDLIIEEREGR
jgi:predicted DNA-binding antitoxin AbrB/MazE fold protein